MADYTSIGTILTSTGTVRAAANPYELLFVDGSPNGYVVTLEDDTFTIIDETDHFYGGTHVVYYNGFLVYNVIDSSFIRCSGLDNALSYDDADVATAENHPDGVIGLAITKNEVWVFGTETIEPWFNAANAEGFPLSPRVGGALTIGCGQDQL